MTAPATRLPSWGVAAHAKHPPPPKAAVAGVAVVFLLGIVVSAVAVPVAGIATTAALGAAFYWWWSRRDERLLASLGAERVAPGAFPRVENIVDGVATDIGIDPPRLYTLPGGPNALVAWVDGASALGVSVSLIEAFSRTELEAVVAHCLARLARGPAAVRAPATPADDVIAAAITRYPPALAAALRRAEPRSVAPERWFVGDGVPAEDRAAAVLDL